MALSISHNDTCETTAQLPWQMQNLKVITLLQFGLMLDDIDGQVQDCCNSIANALELLQSCTKPSIYTFWVRVKTATEISPW